MKYKLILSDLDGTLLRSDKTVSQRTVRALEEARSRGVLFAAATGRFFDGMPRCVRELSVMEYAITVNGAKLLKLSPRQVLSTAELPLDTALALISYFEEVSVLYDCYNQDEAFMPEKFLRALPDYLPALQREMILALRKPAGDLADFLKERGGTVEKMQCFLPNEAMQARLMTQLAERFPRLSCTSSYGNNIEINRQDANKGQALRTLCSCLGIAPEETIAFGDHSNDITMLQAAGLGIAMGNATREAKAAADDVAPTNDEDGVAQVLEALLG